MSHVGAKNNLHYQIVHNNNNNNNNNNNHLYYPHNNNNKTNKNVLSASVTSMSENSSEFSGPPPHSQQTASRPDSHHDSLSIFPILSPSHNMSSSSGHNAVVSSNHSNMMAHNQLLSSELFEEKKMAKENSVENSVFFLQDQAECMDGGCEILLPVWFENLARSDQRTIQLTPLGGPAILWVEEPGIFQGKFKVKVCSVSGNPISSQKFYWQVRAKKK